MTWWIIRFGIRIGSTLPRFARGDIVFFRFHLYSGKTHRNAILHLSKPKVEYKWPKGSGSNSPAVMLTQHPQPLFFCTSYTEIHWRWKIWIDKKWFKLRAQWVGPNNLSESIVCLLQRPTLLEFMKLFPTPVQSDSNFQAFSWKQKSSRVLDSTP